MNQQDQSPSAETGEQQYSGPSKSQVKRDLHALQAMAEHLVSLPCAELERLDLGEATWVAIDETARIKDIRALRRHYKRIANCLARENTEPLCTTCSRHATKKRARPAPAIISWSTGAAG